MTIEERLAEINAREPEEPTTRDLHALAKAEKEGIESAIPLDDFVKQLEGFSGKFVLRLPRSLHRKLKLEADAEGVSLNQYVIYKLAQ